jgi:hypothetical protein
MRIAICFWGLCRSTQYTKDSLERFLFSVLKSAGADYDVYLHGLLIDGEYTNHRSNETNINLDQSLWKYLAPTVYSLEHQKEIDVELPIERYLTHPDPWGKEPSQTYVPHHTFRNHLRSLWSLHKVTKMWEDSTTPYDYIVYIRPDVRLLVPLKIQWLTELKPRTICCPSFQRIDGWNDRFAIATPTEARIWGHRFLGAHAYSLQKPLHSERYLADTMKNAGIQPMYICFPFRRIRADGRVCPADIDL